MRMQLLMAACSVVLWIGCGGESDVFDESQKDTPAPLISEPSTDGQTETTADGGASTGGNTDNVVREDVDLGTTEHVPPKNQDAITKVIRAPLDGYLSAQARIKAGALKHNADIEKNINGEFKDADDYIARVIKPMQIELPELPPGHKFVYDKDQDKLMVEKPAN